MGFVDVLFGRKKLKEASGERLFALSTARVTLETELGLRSTAKAGISFKPLSAGEFVRVENDLQELLEATARDSQSKVRRTEDEYGFTWILVEDPDLEDLVTTVHLVASELQARGFGPQILAAVFGFEGSGRRAFFVYGYKRGAFWPYVPTGEGQERDNARELELKAKLEGELPIEPDLAQWYALSPPG